MLTSTASVVQAYVGGEGCWRGSRQLTGKRTIGVSRRHPETIQNRAQSGGMTMPFWVPYPAESASALRYSLAITL